MSKEKKIVYRNCRTKKEIAIFTDAYNQALKDAEKDRYCPQCAKPMTHNDHYCQNCMKSVAVPFDIDLEGLRKK